MKPPNENNAASEIIDLIAELLGCKSTAIRLHRHGESNDFDYLISTPGHRFIVEYKRVASAAPLANAADQLKIASKARSDGSIPLVAVPFMGQIGRDVCDRYGVSWLDLSGNAKIVAPGLRIWIEGRPNKYKERGRPPNIFASKSSRVVRQLLLHPHAFQAQAEIARQTGLGDGYVSTIVKRLEQEQQIDLNDEAALRPRDPNRLLDTWQAAYDFSRHRILKGHVPARTGDELLQRVSRLMLSEKIDHAATGLGAAWHYTHFAAFRLVTVYLSSMPRRSLLAEIEFSDEPKGANLWLVQPNDVGVFHGCQTQDDLRCVSPLQAYLDLKDQPERAKAASVELRKKFLSWGRHGN